MLMLAKLSRDGSVQYHGLLFVLLKNAPVPAANTSWYYMTSVSLVYVVALINKRQQSDASLELISLQAMLG